MKKKKCRVCKTSYFVPSKWPGCCSPLCLTKRQQWLKDHNKQRKTREEREKIQFRREVNYEQTQLHGGSGKLRDPRRLGFKCFIKAKSHELNNNLPNSERWFWEKFKPFRDGNDKPNVPIGRFIFDVVNKPHKYVIEIDGSIHNLEQQKNKDEMKNKYADDIGYKVIRIKAFDSVDFEKALEIINFCRRGIHKTILLMVNIKKPQIN